MLVPPSADGLGIYVHFPWCLKKCPYCDFLSVAVPSIDGRTSSTKEARDWIPHQKYGAAILREWQARLSQLGQAPPPLRSIFFGGGTPSLFRAEEIGKIIAHILAEYPGDVSKEQVEITVECNPTSLDLDHARHLRAAGVNRLSVGVQNLNRQRLEFLGRLHDEKDGLRAVREAIAAGLPQVSADLIFGIYSQAPDEAQKDAQKVAQTGVNHLSAYSLTIEENTRFGALNSQGKLPLLDDELSAQSFEAVSAAMTKEGFLHYEISNFCRPGSQSVHNLGYWLGRDYLGLGAGAFGTVSLSEERIRYRNLLSPERYMKVWTSPGCPKSNGGLSQGNPYSENLSEREVITPEIAHQESFLLGLRTSFGVDPIEMARLRGGDPLPAERRASVEALLGKGKLELDGSRLTVPSKHWLFADGIIRDLL